MPRQYEAMRNRFTTQGLSLRAAKTKAAKIYSAVHPATPVGPHSDGPPKHKFKFSRPTKTR